LQDYHKFVIKDQKIKSICLTAIYVDISNPDFDRYDITYFICQKINNNVYDIIYKDEHERFENLRLLKCEAEFFQVVPLLNSLKIQEKCLQIHEEKLKNTKNQKIKLICLTTVMVDTSGDATEFDEYVLTRFVCQKVNSNVFEIIHKEVQKHREVAPLPVEDLEDIDSKKIFSYMIDNTWKLDEEDEFSETYELLSFLVSTGFDKNSFNTLLSCGEQLFWKEENWVQNIQIVIYVKNDT